MAAKLAKIVVNQKKTTRNGSDVSTHLFNAGLERKVSRGKVDVLHSSSAHGMNFEEKQKPSVF